MEPATSKAATPSKSQWYLVGGVDIGEVSNFLVDKTTRVGRSPACQLMLDDRSVSGVHAKLVLDGNQLWLHDLGSTNGTFVNGRRVKDAVEVVDGDHIQFAAVLFHLAQSNGPPAQIRTRKELEAASSETIQNIQMERLFDGGVVPFFQPIINISNQQNTVFGLEVLGRSRIFGLRTPQQMFAAAARLEMESELSQVLRQRGVEIVTQKVPKELVLFVNTHPAELTCDGLLPSLRELKNRCPDHNIVLEVAETDLRDTARIIDLRRSLSELEIGLAFDNFGQGQCQLFVLSEVTPDFVKFDQNLIRGIDTASDKRRKFVRALVKMIKDLGVTPLAECVESEAEHNALREIGFDLGQGYHYGKPGSLSDSIAWLSDQPVSSELHSTSATTQTAESPKPEDPKKSAAKDEQWLLQQPASHYTIQVLSAISAERAEAHIAEQDNPEDFAIFCKSGQTRMLYIVVCGVYANREEAKLATLELSSAAVSPWIRMLSGVHSEIRSIRSGKKL